MPKRFSANTPAIDRFLSRVERETSGPKLNGVRCLLWTSSRNRQGYGRMKMRGYVSAHRLAWMLVNGPIPAGLLVRHLCDNPSCVEASHLAIGTQKDNMQDIPPERQRAGKLRAWRGNTERREEMSRRARAMWAGFSPEERAEFLKRRQAARAKT